ncbi:6-phosphogluconolactonase [Corynebacterium felinum]|uniref:6-phosphogluconolactonase n=1 Tax=Corynebacterium felinum TaxID=131318 RepID=A0ABU2BAU2_9CORY|nr:6-phosphogluconolactonase [Corynebacterium felinum]MDF5821976.1 6-phosphogluconolactonase [Corynebacterium felinum]MDR7355728.1 6-phosphogluconolactonase [Corynebacterium felinum]WJY95076.1 6-phosphogluconolactonase [Corynebacterium felinum]
MLEVLKLDSLDEVCKQAAGDFAKVVRDVSKNGGKHGDGLARVVLTGGGAGIGMLRELKDADINWELVHVFFGDERNIDVTHPDSNEGQARTALLEHVDIPEANIHGYGLGGVDMADAAEAYEAVLKDFAPQGFDLHVLGMGGEGHINSLFPHTQAVAEETKLVLPIYDSPKPPSERVTLTLPAIARSTKVWLLVAGEEKAEAAAHVVRGSSASEWPAAGAQGSEQTRLYLAQSAAGLL